MHCLKFCHHLQAFLLSNEHVFLQKDCGHASPYIGHSPICTTNGCHLGWVGVAHICWAYGPSVSVELVWCWSHSSLAQEWSIQS